MPRSKTNTTASPTNSTMARKSKRTVAYSLSDDDDDNRVAAAPVQSFSSDDDDGKSERVLVEDNADPPPQKLQSPETRKPPQHQVQHDGNDDGDVDKVAASGEEVEEPPAPNKKNRPLSPRNAVAAAKSPRAASTSKVQPSPAVSFKPTPLKPCVLATPAKRPSENGSQATKSKKSKVAEKTPRSYPWDETDVIALLEGILEFRSVNGIDPSVNPSKFLEFINDRLSTGVTVSRLMEKVKRLKNKYLKKLEIMSHDGNGGLEPCKPHERESFTLAKKIWGDAVANASAGAKKGIGEYVSPPRRIVRKTAKKSVSNGNDHEDEGMEEVEGKGVDVPRKTRVEKDDGGDDDDDDDDVKLEDEVRLAKRYPSLIRSMKSRVTNENTVGDVALKNVGMVGDSVLMELETEWKKQEVAEMEVYKKRINLVMRETSYILDAMKSRLG
ncbi:hypothetical protein Dimus_032626 [Dionaea muscipula]